MRDYWNIRKPPGWVPSESVPGEVYGGEKIDWHYQIVILRPDQIDLIAERVVEKLVERGGSA